MGGGLCKDDRSVHSVEVKKAPVDVGSILKDEPTRLLLSRAAERTKPRTVVEDVQQYGGEHLCDILYDLSPGETEVEKVAHLLHCCYHLASESGIFVSFLIDEDELDHVLEGYTVRELYRSAPALIGRSTGLVSWLTALSESSCVDLKNCKRSRGIIRDNEAFLISQLSAVACGSFAEGSPSLLFSVSRNGESWMRFIDSVNNYTGPTLLLICTKAGEVLGAFIDGGITETGTKFAGSPETFLFSLRPRLRVCRASGTETNFTLLNQRSSFVPLGLGFGGDEKSFRLLLHADLKHVTAAVSCSTFQFGALMNMSDDQDGSDCFSKTVEISDAEVWGLGGAQHLLEQSRIRDRDENMKAERRTVDKSKLMEGGDLIKKPAAGERQGEVDVIIEERRREKEEAKMKKTDQWK